jgi:hypothetical protein
MRTKGVLKSISRMPPVGAGILRKGPIRDIENEEQRKQTLIMNGNQEVFARSKAKKWRKVGEMIPK